MLAVSKARRLGTRNLSLFIAGLFTALLVFVYVLRVLAIGLQTYPPSGAPIDYLFVTISFVLLIALFVLVSFDIYKERTRSMTIPLVITGIYLINPITFDLNGFFLIPFLILMILNTYGRQKIHG